MRSGAPASSGSSVRPSALVVASFSSPSALAPSSRSTTRTPAAGLPDDRIEHMGRQPAVGLRLARPVDRIDQPQPRDVADLGQRRRPLRVRAVAQPALELVEDGVARVPAHADDEGKSEPLTVGGVEPLEAREFLLAQPGEPQAALLAPRLRCHGTRPRHLARKLRVALDEGELLGLARGRHLLAHDGAEVSHGGKRALGKRPLGDPGRLLEHAAEHPDEGLAVGSIQFVQGRHWSQASAPSRNV